MTVGRWERGEAVPTRQNIAELSQLFEMTPQELGFLSEAPGMEPSSEKSFITDPMIPLPSLQSLIGRDDILEAIQQRLSTGSPAIALHGLPGVGKTTIALSLISRPDIQTLFHDGILWAGLGPNPNVPEILSRWAALLGIAANGTGALKSLEARTRILREVIGARRILIILDDIWDDRDAFDLKVGGPFCAYVATTRSPQIAASFAMHEATSVPELSEEHGIALLGLLAPAIRTLDAKQVRTLVRSVGALPLALTLAGRYLHVQGYHGQPRRLQAAMEHLLDAKRRLHLSKPLESTDVHPNLSSMTSLSLQSVIAVSDQYLDEHAQRALRELSTFPAKPNTFSEEAALAVSTTSIEALDMLSDVGLLEINARGRYTFHQTITDYARSKQTDEDADERFIAYYANYMQKHAANYEEIEQDSGNMLAMLDLAHHRGMKNYLIQGTCAFVPFLLLRGLYDLAEEYLRHAYEVARDDIESEITLLLLLGQTAQKQSNYPLAIDYFQQGLILARSRESPEWISAFLSDLGWVTWKQGHYMQAEEYLREGLDLACQIRNEERICKFLRVLGAVHSSLGNYLQGNEYLREGLDLARQIGNREQICVLLIDLGVSYTENNQSMVADEYLREGLAFAQQIGHREWISLAYLNLAALALEAHRYQEAEEYANDGLALARRIGNREWTCGNLVNLGISVREQGAFSQAQTYFLEAIALAQQLGRPYLTFMAMYEYACNAIEQGDEQTAEALLGAAHTTIPEGDQEAIGLYLLGMARLAALRGNIPEALQLGKESRRNIIRSNPAKDVEQWLAKLLSSTQQVENPVDSQALH